MKRKNIIKILVCAIIAGLIIARAILLATTKPSIPETRAMTGNYYDYMVVNTVDGNDFFIDPQLFNGNEAPFEEGELIQVVFNTNQTETVLDDTVIFVRSI